MVGRDRRARRAIASAELLCQILKPVNEIPVHQIDSCAAYFGSISNLDDHSTYDRLPSVIGSTRNVVRWSRTGTGELTNVYE
jgi:hypothetical protein